jgi:hypothetical protein
MKVYGLNIVCHPGAVFSTKEKAQRFLVDYRRKSHPYEFEYDDTDEGEIIATYCNSPRTRLQNGSVRSNKATLDDFDGDGYSIQELEVDARVREKETGLMEAIEANIDCQAHEPPITYEKTIRLNANTLIRKARTNGYVSQKEWLKKHGFDLYESYAQWVVVAEMIASANGTKKDFDNVGGFNARARGNDARNTMLHGLLDARLRKQIVEANPSLTEDEIESERLKLRSNDAVRKDHLRDMRKIARRIFHTYNEERVPANI